MHITPRRLLLLLGVTLGILVALVVFISYVSVFDKEWYDYKVLKYVNNASHNLYKYKQVNSKVPDTFDQIGMTNKYCVLLFKCFKIVYTPSPDRQSYTIVTEPRLVIADGKQCLVSEDRSRICSGFSYSR